MKLAIVGYPTLDAHDRQWIESIRVRHDPQASRIDMHFTLVFPFEALSGDLGPEIAAVAETTPPISFVIRRTAMVPDVLGSGSHVFLVPDEGGSQITSLHDRLYAGALRPHLRSDIPFVPHMTIGFAPDVQSGEMLAREFGARSRTVRGLVGSVELIDISPARVQSIATYALGNARRAIQT